METPHGSSIQWYAYEPSFDVFSFVYDLHVFFYLHDIQWLVTYNGASDWHIYDALLVMCFACCCLSCFSLWWQETDNLEVWGLCHCANMNDYSNCNHYVVSPCGLWGCKNRPALFPAGQMSYKATKPGLVSVLYLSMRYTVLFIRAHFYVSLVFVAMCSLFWLFWLRYQYLPNDWLERLVWRSPIVAIISRKPKPKSACDFLGLLYCFIVLLLCICVVSCSYVI